MNTSINFTRVNNDTNGNPRYVVHFLDFVINEDYSPNLYEIALKKAKTIGGKKFNNKQYGGGIVFQSYNIYDLEERINTLIAKNIRLEYLMSKESNSVEEFREWLNNY